MQDKSGGQMTEHRSIWCCGCGAEIPARLTYGREIYPHRPDLAHLPFWRCDNCRNYVGCHHKTKDSTRPLGNIPTPELRRARSEIHKILDPIWRERRMDRGELYSEIARRLGVQKYHTAEIRTVEEARSACRVIREIEAAPHDRQ